MRSTGEALKGYEEALALHQKTDDVAGIAFVSLSIGNIGYLQGDYPAAIAAYQRSLDLNRTMFNVDGESRALEGLGRVFMAQGDYAGALVAFDAVRTDKRMATVRGRLAAVAQSIGDVHFRLANLDAARASYEESRGHFEAVGDLPNVGRVLQAMAVTELVAARFNRAEDLYKRSGAICTSADDGECAARAIAGLAFAQSAQDRFFEAAASYRKAIDAFTARGLREEAARSEIGLSQALAGAGDFAGGVEAAVRARREAMAIENDDVMWRALTAEARAVRKLGDGERALGDLARRRQRAGSNGRCRAGQAGEQPDERCDRRGRHLCGAPRGARRCPGGIRRVRAHARHRFARQPRGQRARYRARHVGRRARRGAHARDGRGDARGPYCPREGPAQAGYGAHRGAAAVARRSNRATPNVDGGPLRTAPGSCCLARPRETGHDAGSRGARFR